MPKLIYVAEASLPWIAGKGASEEEAFLDAARRLKARVDALTVEQIAELLEGDVSWEEGNLPTTDGFGATGWKEA